MKEIPLTRGQVALVDDGDFEMLSQYKWHAWWSRETRGFYAVRMEYLGTISGKQQFRMVAMHRIVLGLKHEDKREGEHVNAGHTLDNRRFNLRTATRAQNQANRRKQCNNTSGFKGVVFHRPSGKWQAQIRALNRYFYLGLFPTPEEAYAAYCRAALEHHGEFARLA